MQAAGIRKRSSGEKKVEAQEDSSFFKELGKVSDLKVGSEKVNLKYVIKSDKLAEEESLKDFLDADGNLVVDLTADVVSESETKVAVDLSVNMGTKINGKMATLVVDGNILYLEYKGLLDTLKSFKDNEQIASAVQQIESNFGSAIKVDVKKVSEVVKPIMDKLMESTSTSNPEVGNIAKVYMAVVKDLIKNPQGANELVKSLSDAAEKNYENLEGVDGDMYTLTINADNAQKMVDDTENFVKNDAQKLVEDAITYVYKVAGEDALGKPESELKAKVPEWVDKAATEIAKNKDKVVEEIQKAKLDGVLKVKVDEGKSANFEIAMKMEAEGTSMDYTGSVEFKAGSASIKDKIPADANDITTMITTLINMYSSQITGAASDADLPVEQ